MRYLLLVHHNEEAFGRMSEEMRRSMLAESIQLCHRLYEKGQYVHASPLQPVATATGNRGTPWRIMQKALG